jgi:hypothetical protein
MIEWSVLFHSLWLSGLSILLAIFSLAHWSARLTDETTRQVLSKPIYRLSIAAGLSLTGLGAMLVVSTWWLKVGWACLVALALWEGLAAWLGDSGEQNRS